MSYLLRLLSNTILILDEVSVLEANVTSFTDHASRQSHSLMKLPCVEDVVICPNVCRVLSPPFSVINGAITLEASRADVPLGQPPLPHRPRSV